MLRSDIVRRISSGVLESRRKPVLWAVLIVWLASVGTGLGWLMAYDNKPGAPAQAPAGWPASGPILTSV